MKVPFKISRLIDIEMDYYKRFTGVINKSYGFIFFNEAIKASHNSNHAVITDHLGLEASIKDITFFYKSKGITPRIYSALKENELIVLTPHLQNHGYIIEKTNGAYYLHEREPQNVEVHGISFDRLKQIKDDLRELVLSSGFGDWELKVLERHMRHPGYHLLGGFVEAKLVTIASISIFEGYSRVDDVLTHIFYRGKGYSSALINYLIRYHNEMSDNHLYIYSAIPEASKIYEKAGFTRILSNIQTWQAYKPLQ